MKFLTEADKKAVAAAIAAAEKGTTGEIRVHVAALPPPGDILDAAQRLFRSFNMERTAARNGVLVLVSPVDKRFAIWGDEGIHQKAGQPLWDTARAELKDGFAAGKRAEALVACVAEVGKALALHFPSIDGGSNELHDEVTEV